MPRCRRTLAAAAMTCCTSAAGALGDDGAAAGARERRGRAPRPGVRAADGGAATRSPAGPERDMEVVVGQAYVFEAFADCRGRSPTRASSPSCPDTVLERDVLEVRLPVRKAASGDVLVACEHAVPEGHWSRHLPPPPRCRTRSSTTPARSWSRASSPTASARRSTRTASSSAPPTASACPRRSSSPAPRRARPSRWAPRRAPSRCACGGRRRPSTSSSGRPTARRTAPSWSAQLPLPPLFARPRRAERLRPRRRAVGRLRVPRGGGARAARQARPPTQWRAARRRRGRRRGGRGGRRRAQATRAAAAAYGAFGTSDRGRRRRVFW